MNKQTEALKLALEALEVDAYVYNGEKSWKAITAIKEALAQPATLPEQPDQEPNDLTIAYMSGLHDGKQKRPWVGLTHKEIDSHFEDHGWSTSEHYYPVIRDIETKLKEKNK